MKYISIPMPLFVFFIVASVVFLVIVLWILIEIVSEQLYQMYEAKKYKNKHPKK